MKLAFFALQYIEVLLYSSVYALQKLDQQIKPAQAENSGHVWELNPENSG